MIVKAEDSQTLFDLALFYYGGFEGVFLLMEDNDLAIDTELTPGQELIIRDVVPVLNDYNQALVLQQVGKKTFNSGYEKELIAGDYVAPGYVGTGYVI